MSWAALRLPPGDGFMGAWFSLRTGGSLLRETRRGRVSGSGAHSRAPPVREEKKVIERREVFRQHTLLFIEKGKMDLTMKLVATTDYLRQLGRPVAVKDFEMSMGFKLDEQLRRLIATLERVSLDQQGQTLVYVPLHNIKSGTDLLRVLETQRVFAGLSVKQLKDGWPECLDEITALEQQHRIIVYRTKKDQSPRHVWLNSDRLPLRAHEDPQLTALWNSVEVPGTLVDTLVKNGLKPTSVQPESLKGNQMPVRQQRRKKVRRGKITNLHMRGVLKDYSK